MENQRINYFILHLGEWEGSIIKMTLEEALRNYHSQNPGVILAEEFFLEPIFQKDANLILTPVYHQTSTKKGDFIRINTALNNRNFEKRQVKGYPTLAELLNDTFDILRPTYIFARQIQTRISLSEPSA